MIVYNITMKIDPSIEAEWLRWQKDEHIPDVMETGYFKKYKFYKLLEQDENDGITYIVQYFTQSHDQYKKYLADSAQVLRKKAIDKWGDKVIAFRTIMQAVN